MSLFLARHCGEGFLFVFNDTEAESPEQLRAAWLQLGVLLLPSAGTQRKGHLVLGTGDPLLLRPGVPVERTPHQGALPKATVLQQGVQVEESPSEAPGRSSSHFPHLFTDGEKASFRSSSLRKLGFLLSEVSARKEVEFSCLTCRASCGGKPTRQQASTFAPKEQCKGSSKVTALLAWPCSLYRCCNP